MKNTKSFLGLAALLSAIIALALTGCPDPDPSVTVSPKTPVVEAGDKLTFTATVSGTNPRPDRYLVRKRRQRGYRR
jgi:uncharacterized lipoprotein YajG